MSSYYGGSGHSQKDAKWTNYRDYLTGPHASSYEDYIKKIFKPGQRVPQSVKNKLQENNPEYGISARSMIRVGEALGKEALDDRLDDYRAKPDNEIDTSLLDAAVTEIQNRGIPQERPQKKFLVYQPKQSSEYYSILHARSSGPQRPSAPQHPSGHDHPEDDPTAPTRAYRVSVSSPPLLLTPNY